MGLTDSAIDAQARIEAVSLSSGHTFSKPRADGIRLLAGLGIEGDAHCGETVRHRSRVAADPSQPNLRQVHLVHGELFDELAEKGFTVRPGDIGDNVTTRGIDLLGLPTGTLLALGPEAVVEVTGLRNPCRQIDDFQAGLMHAVLDKTPDGHLVRKSGVMAIVRTGGMVRPGDAISITLPEGAPRPLGPV